ncbi:MAG TPA: competence/damage-inducible protein A [Firmicutes bacterium]|nr:competence/damage-inducible protein A [Candidatus Fermentithermobacillaceae bacterium]
MQAEVLSVGTELLLGEITDTNAQYISRRLRDAGVDVYRRVTIGDNPARLTACFREALGRADIVIATGGLGPTADDLTAKCLAEAMGRELVFNQEAWEMTADWFRKRGREPRQTDRKQAMIIEGGRFLPNSNGTAPGQAIFAGGKLAALLPGPPREMVPMFEDHVVPLLKESFPGLVPLTCKDLHVVGIGEGQVQEILDDLMKSANPTLAPYAGLAEVRLRIAARGHDPEESLAMVRSMEQKVRERIGDYIYGTTGDSLEGVCAGLLKKTGLTLAVAESCTGGLVCNRLTDVPGVSASLRMGTVAYSPAVKASVLGVPQEAVRLDEAVNPDTARAMAQSVRALSGAKIGLATTGFAGPGGGTENAPVGTVYIALAHADDVIIEKHQLAGARKTIKERAAQNALILLWKFLKSQAGGRSRGN